MLRDAVPALHHHLQHEPAHLAALTVLRRVVVQHGHVAGALQQTVEIVGVDAHLVLDGGQLVSLTDAVRDERAVVHTLGHVALVARQQQHVVEVKVARLQHTHDLHTLGRLAVEGDAGLLHQLHRQPLQRLVAHHEVPADDEAVEPVDQRVGAEQRLLEQRVVALGTALARYLLEHLQQRRTVVADETGVGMAVEGAHQTRRAAANHQVVVSLDERRHGGLPQRIARGDVHLLHLVGQTVDHRGQQALVAQHDGGAAPVLVAAVLAQPVADVAGLDVLRGRSHVSHRLRLAELPVDVVVGDVQLVGESSQILADIPAGLMLTHVVVVEVPVEAGLPLALQVAEQLLFHTLHQVEAHEQVAVVGKRDAAGIGQPAAHLAVERTLVGQSLLAQPTVEVVVDVGKAAPQSEETLLQLRLVLVGEVAEEAAQQLPLLVGEVAQVVQLVDVAQVGKHLVGVGHVLVDVVEVADEQLTPAVELVERLLRTRLLAERPVQLAHQLHRVGNIERALLPEQFADGDIRRTPQRLLCRACQPLVQKQRRALVGEYHHRARQVSAILADNILGHISQKFLHSLIFSPLTSYLSPLQSYYYTHTTATPSHLACPSAAAAAYTRRPARCTQPSDCQT